MPVIPHPTHLFQDSKALYEFLFACQQKSIEKNQTQIVSISLEVPPLDPLAVLHEINQPDKIHFYFEKGRAREVVRPLLREGKLTTNGDAIAAIDAALHFTAEGQNRFSRAQDFIRTCLRNTITAGALHLPFAGPHFFCSFTFFERSRPEDSSFPAASVFLPRWQVARRNNHCVVVANLAVDAKANLKTLSAHLHHQLQKLIILTNYELVDCYDKTENLIEQSIKHENRFKNSVLAALNSIESERFNKIVLAHTIDVISKSPFNLIHSLNKLRKNHPDCYIFSTGNGKGQNFIGASPERLGSIQNCVLATDALAGSAPRGKTAAEDANLAKALLNSEKERREHQVVRDFIVQRLSRLGLKPKLSPPARLLQLSNIQHLWTPIQAQVPADVSLLDIVAELHPTPAVAGAPRDIACEEIRRYESFERSLYAAPLGWIDHQGNGEFIVGIRSAKIEGNRAKLYAGAGIVAGSDPEKELAEIKLKLQALLRALI